MKDRPLVFVSLGLSLLSLGYAGWIHYYFHQAAVQAFRQRQQEAISDWRMRMGVYKLYSGLSAKDPVPPVTVKEQPLEKTLPKSSQHLSPPPAPKFPGAVRE